MGFFTSFRMTAEKPRHSVSSQRRLPAGRQEVWDPMAFSNKNNSNNKI